MPRRSRTKERNIARRRRRKSGKATRSPGPIPNDAARKLEERNR